MKIYNWNYFIMGIIFVVGVVIRLFDFSGLMDLFLIALLIYQANRAFRISRKKKETQQNNN